MNDRTKSILDLIERLSDEIRLARALGLSGAAHIIEIAQLELKAVAYGITDDEMRAFTVLLANHKANDEAAIKNGKNGI